MLGWRGPKQARDVIRRSRERYLESHPEVRTAAETQGA
jgi:hypothetical protein